MHLTNPVRLRSLVAAMPVTIVFLTVGAGVGVGAAVEEPKPLSFEVTCTATIHRGPITSRVFLLFAPAGDDREPRKGPDWFHPQPFFAVDARDWKPGEPLRFDDGALGYPGPLSRLKPGRYAVQAVVRLNPDTHKLGDGEGNAYGPVKIVEIESGGRAGGAAGAGESARAKANAPIPVVVDRLVAAQPFPESSRVKLVELPSPLLSAFHGRPIRHRAAVILPAGEPTVARASLYVIPGFGGNHRMALEMVKSRRQAYGTEMIRVVLDPDCGTGHHVFADSATNGPRGRALVEELIPHIEKTFPAIPEASARLLNGHSSGGWSSLWLQVTYPDTFGGTWSTSPDSVDFRDFQQVDLYENGADLFRDRDGNRRPIARRGERPVLYFDEFSRMEEVYGAGGQLGSFEAVFSPVGNDGLPRRLWDRRGGGIDPDVARAWEAYDLRRVLERDWPSRGPRLAGKLHVITGALDTFYLEGAVRRLKESLAALGSDAVIEIVPGKDHNTILAAPLAARFDREMKNAVKQKHADARENDATPSPPAPQNGR